MNVNSLYSHFKSSKHGHWILDPRNVRQLYAFIQKHDIRRVLDLGTGIGLSCSVAALAFKDKGIDGHVDSVEQFDKCIKIANELIPEELRKYITVHKSGTELWKTPIPHLSLSTYSVIPDEEEEEYDLTLVDGPGPWKEGDFLIDYSNGDIIKLLIEDRIKLGSFVAWDGRLEALRLLERYYSSNFYIYQFANKGEDFNVLQRKDNPPELQDEKCLMMEESGYFKEE